MGRLNITEKNTKALVTFQNVSKSFGATKALIDCNVDFKKGEIHSLVGENGAGKSTLGKIIFSHVENGSYLPDWHPDENYSKSYAARNDLGGGVVLTCIHEIDYLYWIFGNVSEVFSISGKFTNARYSLPKATY